MTTERIVAVITDDHTFVFPGIDFKLDSVFVDPLSDCYRPESAKTRKPVFRNQPYSLMSQEELRGVLESFRRCRKDAPFDVEVGIATTRRGSNQEYVQYKDRSLAPKNTIKTPQQSHSARNFDNNAKDDSAKWSMGAPSANMLVPIDERKECESPSLGSCMDSLEIMINPCISAKDMLSDWPMSTSESYDSWSTPRDRSLSIKDSDCDAWIEDEDSPTKSGSSQQSEWSTPATIDVQEVTNPADIGCSATVSLTQPFEWCHVSDKDVFKGKDRSSATGRHPSKHRSVQKPASFRYAPPAELKRHLPCKPEDEEGSG